MSTGLHDLLVPTQVLPGWSIQPIRANFSWFRTMSPSRLVRRQTVSQCIYFAFATREFIRTHRKEGPFYPVNDCKSSSEMSIEIRWYTMIEVRTALIFCTSTVKCLPVQGSNHLRTLSSMCWKLILFNLLTGREGVYQQPSYHGADMHFSLNILF